MSTSDYKDYGFRSAAESHTQARFVACPLTETGFVNLQFRGAGRVPGLWMTMVMSGDRPSV